ncbi:MAG: N-acetyltransferase family protein [Balneolaceae bacterium]|nr:MAG: N-acetyltransferase family protein [Balneolaceae bacterium]
MTDADAADVLRIFEEGMKTGLASLETEVPDWVQWDASHLKTCRLVGCIDGTIAGWAALTPVSGRCVYGGVAEESVYVGESFRGMGTGVQLLNALIGASEKEGFWTLQAGILSENKASIRAHEKAGFRIVGIREKLGRRNGTWKDIVLMERRSTKF